MLIVFLPNLLIILLFKYAGPKTDGTEMYEVTGLMESTEIDVEKETEGKCTQLKAIL